MILVFDTETNGKADFRAPFEASHQPQLVQLGAQLLDDEFKVRAELNLIVKPNGWTIPEEVAAIHGITTEIANRFGVPLDFALMGFIHLAVNARVLVAHNFNFDSLILSSAFHRTDEAGEQWLEGKQIQFCTMEAMTGVCKLPGNYGKFKWPKLQEAYKHCFQKEFVGAHDAMADVRACGEIYRWLQEKAKAPA